MRSHLEVASCVFDQEYLETTADLCRRGLLWGGPKSLLAGKTIENGRGDDATMFAMSFHIAKIFSNCLFAVLNLAERVDDKPASAEDRAHTSGNSILLS